MACETLNKLYVATPMYGGNCTAGYTSSMINLGKVLSYQHMFVTNESLVTRARNALTHCFLQSDCTHLLFVDADVAFDAEGIPQMLQSGKDIIGGLYAKKQINWHKVLQTAALGCPPEQLSTYAADYYAQGDIKIGYPHPIEIRSVGTGLMMISRNVFEKRDAETKAAKFGSAVIGEISSNTMVKQFFESGIDAATGEFLSEDYAFCQKWRNTGGTVWAAPWIRTMHIGTHNFG